MSQQNNNNNERENDNPFRMSDSEAPASDAKQVPKTDNVNEAESTPDLKSDSAMPEGASGSVHHHSHSGGHTSSEEHSHRSSSDGDSHRSSGSRSRNKSKNSHEHHHSHHHHHQQKGSGIGNDGKKIEYDGKKFDSTEANQIPGRFNRMRRHKHKKNSLKKVLLGILIAILVIILAAAAVFTVFYFRGKSSLLTHDVNVFIPDNVGAVVDNDGAVTYGDAKYVYNENITNVLLMGVDRMNIDDTNEEIGTNGQADAIYLLSIDTVTGKKSILSISRDSMVDVNVYSVSGEFIGTETKQLCLAYSYGDGKETSCENVVTAVSRMLYGIPVQSYAAIDLDAIETLTDVVGGVNVPEYDSDYVPTGGTITLYGDTVRQYVQFRDTSQLDSNNNRRERQLNYIKSFVSTAIAGTKADISFPIGLYNSISADMVTNIDASELTYLSTLAVNNNSLNYASVSGTVTMGEKYAEFNVDEAALYEMILNTFYTKQ